MGVYKIWPRIFSTDLEVSLVAISLALCDFKPLRFEIAAV